MGKYLLVNLPHPGRYYIVKEQSNTIKILDFRGMKDDLMLEKWIEDQNSDNIENDLDF